MNSFALSPIQAVTASGPGALDGFECKCGCGLVIRSSLLTICQKDAADHAEWHRKKEGGALVDDVLTELRLATESIDRGNAAQRHKQELTDRAINALWDDNAALRDELHAVANRLENLTRALMAEPAEVADKIVRLADADN